MSGRSFHINTGFFLAPQVGHAGAKRTELFLAQGVHRHYGRPQCDWSLFHTVDVLHVVCAGGLCGALVGWQRPWALYSLLPAVPPVRAEAN